MARLFTLPKEDIEHMLRAAVEHYSQDRMKDAEKLLWGILTLEPQEWRAWQLLGSILALGGFRVAAEQAYKRCIEANPKDPYALVALAEIALDAMRFEDAKRYLEKLFALDPESKHPAANRGRMILNQALERFGAK